MPRLASAAELLGEVLEFAMAKLLKGNPMAIDRRSDEISKKTMPLFKYLCSLGYAGEILRIKAFLSRFLDKP
jgi:hypothetical protein